MKKMNKKGFTLVELMVVLAILGLLAAIGIPQYTKVMERARIGRDVAAIATVQTAVDAFLTETQWRPSPAAVELNSTNVKAKSLLTGAEVTIDDFLDDDELPGLESKFVKGGTWYLDTDGTVYVTKAADGKTNRLPEKTATT